MIELEVPKDIRRYEAKLFGPFTTRQLICFAIAVAIAFGLYFVLGDILPRDATYLLIIIVCIPFLLCGWYKPYGMHFEQFVRVAFVTTFVSPAVRKYVIENKFSTKIKDDKTAQNNKKQKQKKQIKSKNPELIAYK